MPRGRQYYDPIVHVPGKTDAQTDYSRIELFPAGAEALGRLPQDQGKWIGRLISPDGSISEEAPGDFDHDRALAQAEQLWPGLTVYELNAEHEDSTWDGAGPSPRIWQTFAPSSIDTALKNAQDALASAGGPDEVAKAVREAMGDVPPAVEVQLRVMPISQPGNYVLLDDIRGLLESWAVAYDVDKNPSAAMALREAVDALKDIV